MTACGSGNNRRQICWEQQAAREISLVVAPGSLFGIPVIKKGGLARRSVLGVMESIVYIVPARVGQSERDETETRAHNRE